MYYHRAAKQTITLIHGKEHHSPSKQTLEMTFHKQLLTQFHIAVLRRELETAALRFKVEAPSPQEPSPFLLLPPEIRKLIYEYLVVDALVTLDVPTRRLSGQEVQSTSTFSAVIQTSYWWFRHRLMPTCYCHRPSRNIFDLPKPPMLPSITQVNKLLRKESLPLYYKRNSFLISINTAACSTSLNCCHVMGLDFETVMAGDPVDALFKLCPRYKLALECFEDWLAECVTPAYIPAICFAALHLAGTPYSPTGSDIELLRVELFLRVAFAYGLEVDLYGANTERLGIDKAIESARSWVEKTAMYRGRVVRKMARGVGVANRLPKVDRITHPDARFFLSGGYVISGGRF